MRHVSQCSVVNLDNFFGYRVIRVDLEDFSFVEVGSGLREARLY